MDFFNKGISSKGKCFCILALTLIVSFPSFSQKALSAQISSPRPFSFSSSFVNSDERRTETYDFFDVDDSTLILARAEGNFVKDDSSLAYTYSNELIRVVHDTLVGTPKKIAVTFENHSASVFCFILFDSKFFALATYQANDSLVKVCAQELNTVSLAKIGAAKEVFSYHNAYKLDPLKTHNIYADLPHCIKSANGKHLLFAFAEAHNGKTKNNIHFKIFDNSFDGGWSQDYGLPVGSECFETPDFKTPDLKLGLRCAERFDIDAFQISNDGTVFFKGIARGKKREKEYRNRTSTESIFHVISFSTEHPEIYDQQINPDHRIVDFKVEKPANGRIIIVGYYSLGNDDDHLTGMTDEGDNLDGVFYFSYYPGDKKSVIKFYYSTSSEILESEDNGKKQPQHLQNYKIGDLLVNEAGEAYLLSQYEYSESGSGSYTNAPGAAYVEGGGEAFINDILIYSFKPDGSLNWTQRLSKKQLPQEENATSGYYVIYSNDKLFILYAENEDNPVSENRSDQHAYTAKKSGRLVYMSVEKSGLMVKHVLGVYKTSGKNMPPMPSNKIYKATDRSYYFVGRLGIDKRVFYNLVLQN